MPTLTIKNMIPFHEEKPLDLGAFCKKKNNPTDKTRI